jgi:hypothetical protein
MLERKKGMCDEQMGHACDGDDDNNNYYYNKITVCTQINMCTLK